MARTEPEPFNLTPSDTASILPEGSLERSSVTDQAVLTPSRGGLRSRRWLLLTTLSAVACGPAQAAAVLGKRSNVPYIEIRSGIKPDEAPTPVSTPRPTEAPPTQTPRSTETPTRTPTPEPTHTLLPEGAYYAAWPSNIAEAMTRLVLPDGVRLVKSPNSPPGQPGCVVACYNFNPDGSKYIWVISPTPPDRGPEVVYEAYELGHAHKQKVRETEGIFQCPAYPNDSSKCWAETTEYRAFVVALSSVNNRLSQERKSQIAVGWDAFAAHSAFFAGYVLGDPAFVNPPADWKKWMPDTRQYPELVTFYDKWAKKN